MEGQDLDSLVARVARLANGSSRTARAQKAIEGEPVSELEQALVRTLAGLGLDRPAPPPQARHPGGP